MKLTTRIALSAAVLVLSCGMAGAQGFGGFRPAPVPEDLHTIVSGDVTLTINAAEGGKVVSFKYKDTEVLSKNKFPNAYGSTFWTSPQVEWNWPPVAEIDRLPYEIVSENVNSEIVLKGKVSEKVKYSVSKKFAVDAKDGAIVATYTITNAADETRKVAPWEITRVPGEGTVFFDCPLSGITPEGLMPFTEAYKVSWLKFDVQKENRKINADGKGWLAYVNNGLMMVKKFPNITPDQPAPKEAEIQVYINAGSTYVELESQGAYTELKPGESFDWTVRWYLVPVGDEQAPSKALLKKARKL
ncbi:MAG: DUF4380 domain-containing protein [Bacteroidales bacterium]|nr:DUF4380 domain-containing protein [Bacteroidales bacterium]